MRNLSDFHQVLDDLLVGISMYGLGESDWIAADTCARVLALEESTDETLTLIKKFRAIAAMFERNEKAWLPPKECDSQLELLKV